MSAVHLGQLVQKRRLARGISVSQAARDIGITRASMIGLEAGANEPRLSTMARICDLLVIDPQVVMREVLR